MPKWTKLADRLRAAEAAHDIHLSEITERVDEIGMTEFRRCELRIEWVERQSLPKVEIG